MAEPFLRWAGGKRWLSQLCAHLLSSRLKLESVYIEPFLGSGSMYFHTCPSKAVLGDVNGELINAFRIVRDNVEELEKKILALPVTKSSYYRIRNQSPRSSLNKAARFIYLNRTAFGGLYRTNQQGKFNVPYGGGDRNARSLIENGLLKSASDQLKSTSLELIEGDFAISFQRADEGDVIYCDPCYRSVDRTGYDRYNPCVYSWDDQLRLISEARNAYLKGTLVLLSSYKCDYLPKLLPEAAQVTVERRKGLGASKAGQDLREYLFILDPLEDWSSWHSLGSMILPHSTTY